VHGQEPDAGVLVERRGDQRDLDLPGHERQLVRGGARGRSSPPRSTETAIVSADWPRHPDRLGHRAKRLPSPAPACSFCRPAASPSPPLRSLM
jgi:hypothetical protein